MTCHLSAAASDSAQNHSSVQEMEKDRSSQIETKVEIETCIHELLRCQESCNSITLELVLLDVMIKDRFADASQNEAARQFLLEAYKELLINRASDLEDSLISVRDRLKKLKNNKEMV